MSASLSLPTRRGLAHPNALARQTGTTRGLTFARDNLRWLLARTRNGTAADLARAYRSDHRQLRAGARAALRGMLAGRSAA